MAAIKTILVHAERSDNGERFLTEAASFAAGLDAHLVALVIGMEQTPAYSSFADMPMDAYFIELKEIREKVQETITWVSERLDNRGLSFEVRGVVAPEGTEGFTFARHARYADLALLLRDEGALNWHRLHDGALFDSGRPVLLCPPGASLKSLGGCVVIGWDAGGEAARAVTDSLALISGAGDIRVVTVDPHVGPDGHGEEPGADLAAFLARHGLRVTVDAIPRGNRSIADALLVYARSIGADLIVAGAYGGRSRFSEIILGGPTRDIMEAIDRPLFMAH